jgi:cytochrome c oxidase subunit 2
MILAVEFPLFPTRASTLAGSVDRIYFILLGITAFFSTLIFLCIAYFAIKYRRRSESERPAEIRGSLKLEIVWTAIPLAIVTFLFIAGVRIYYAGARPPADSMPIYVVGKQWMWKVQHPEGKSEIDELHVPLGTPVKLIMTSEDVIHDFSIPAFRIKRDVLPGRYTTEWFQATKTGDFHLFCAQYCGTNHSAMVGRVVVMEPADFEAWMGQAPQAPSMAETGQRLFTTLNCATCHSDPRKAPLLAGRYGSEVPLADGRRIFADEGYMRESILSPRSKIVAGYSPTMPTYQGQLNESQVLELIAYMESLGNQKGKSGP